MITTIQNIIDNYKIHPSMRGRFGYELFKLMANDPTVYLLTGDLGYKLFDNHFEYFKDRCINCGASEQAMLGIACGMALEGKIPFVYSITPFLLYRGFETIRNYLGHENIPVKLCGSGRDGDYKDDGFSHWAHEAEDVLKVLPAIQCYWPMNEENVTQDMKEIYGNKSPSFLSLKR
jgi:transketolase